MINLYFKLIFIFMLAATNSIGSERQCSGERKGDEFYLDAAKIEMGKRVKDFAIDNYSYKISYDNCVVEIYFFSKRENKTGNRSIVYLSYDGSFERYFGGM